MNNFNDQLLSNKELIDKKSATYFKEGFLLDEALSYATADGKRIRASLYLETLKMLGKEIREADYDFALALELIHAYSLVHDDLPAMDDDDYRRGKEAVHKKFGEDIGILTGDGLLNEAASLLFKISLADNSYLKAAAYVMDAAGYKGMIEGQVLDLRASNYDLDYLLRVYELKTSMLFRAAIVGAGLVAGVGDQNLAYLDDFAYNLGLAFQIQDDLLEKTYEDELNILNLMENEAAKDLLADIDQKARAAIDNFDDNDFLLSLIAYLSKRDN